MTAIQFIAWAEPGVEPVFLRDAAALVRWAAADGRPSIEVWHLDNATATMRHCTLQRIAPEPDADHLWFLNGLEIPGPGSAEVGSLSDREQAVVEFFENHLPADVEARRVQPGSWNFAPGVELDPTGTYAVFGFLPPMSAVGQWRWYFCPEVIAGQASSLDPKAFEFYLSTIEMRIAMWWVHPDLEPLARDRQTEEMVYASAPAAAQVIAEMQMAVLDQQARTP